MRDHRPAVVTGSAVLWVHGGGFSSGGLDQKESDAPARFLAGRGRWVRTVDYRLAPRLRLFRRPDLTPHPGRYPAALHDVVDAAAALSAESGRPVVLGGASAGATLAAGAALVMRDEHSDPPAALALAYGGFHAGLPPDENLERQLRGLLARWAFNPRMVRRIALNYVGDEQLLTPGRAFPGGTDLRGLPPTLVLDARNDRLRRSGQAFAAELRTAGVEVTEHVVDAGHAFLDRPRTPGFTQGMNLFAEWLDSAP